MTSDVREPGGQRQWHVSPAHRHLVQFYESEDYLLNMLSQFVVTSLRNNEAAIVVATEQHISQLNGLLEAEGIDLPAAVSTGQLTALDAASTMRKFMVEDRPDSAKFHDLFGSVIAGKKEKWPSVRIFGEMVALTAERNNEPGTMELEELWNDLQETLDFSLCCAYPLGTFNSSTTAGMLQHVCDQHSAVFPAESYSTLKTDEERFREITLLQQKAAQLEEEIRIRAEAQEQMREALEAERTARQAAETALYLRDEFVSIAAHELKTPLTSLIGRAQLALRRCKRDGGGEPEDITHLVQSVVDQSGKLSRLVAQLLDVSRLKGGRLCIDPQLVDLVPLLEEAVCSVDTSIYHQKVKVLAPESLMAEVDPTRLEQVVVNLLNNALKYSPRDGTVTVSLSHGDAGSIEIAVQDEGPGIPVSERERIFERFYQASQQGSPGGMGLGLYISREIVQLHGGDVLAEFPERGGTKFIVRLPTVPDHSAAPVS